MAAVVAVRFGAHSDRSGETLDRRLLAGLRSLAGILPLVADRAVTRRQLRSLADSRSISKPLDSLNSGHQILVLKRIIVVGPPPRVSAASAASPCPLSPPISLPDSGHCKSPRHCPIPDCTPDIIFSPVRELPPQIGDLFWNSPKGEDDKRKLRSSIQEQGSGRVKDLVGAFQQMLVSGEDERAEVNQHEGEVELGSECAEGVVSSSVLMLVDGLVLLMVLDLFFD